MGAQDSFDRAQDFVDDTGTESFRMIWDESFETWRYYGIPAQPAAWLVTSTGDPIESWLGAFDVDDVLALARAA